MKESFAFRNGIYKIGLGGLHSQHDLEVCYEANEEWMISDIDAASYYPSILLNCGLVPKLSGDKGETFLDAYADIYHRRLDAKEAGDKATAGSLKIALNGLFGKLGNWYSAFYSPDLLLAITITGQLNLLTLIDDLVKTRGIEVVSANTDGIMVRYKASLRDKMLKIVAAHGKKTGFEYEETRYRKVAIANVNNYIAVKLDGGLKLKGLFAKAGVLEMKNPTAEVCSQAAAQYLVDGTLPEVYIAREKDIRQFVTIRGVSKPGGVQHTHSRMIDEWVEVEPRVWQYKDKIVKRKSRPPAVEEYYGGVPFGRVARWYMTTAKLPPIQRVDNGYLVAKTEGARLCMTLPDELPSDLNTAWYINETYGMLKNMGVKF
jgi:DNA polymerase elongation subunit (family B)